MRLARPSQYTIEANPLHDVASAHALYPYRLRIRYIDGVEHTHYLTATQRNSCDFVSELLAHQLVIPTRSEVTSGGLHGCE